MNKRKQGDFYEEAVSQYLISNGIEIIERNYRCKLGEIDIIGKQDDTIIFFEVKYRKSNAYGYAVEAVDYRKRKKIISCAKFYIAFKNIDSYIRFDVIGITGDEFEWIKNAFWV